MSLDKMRTQFVLCLVLVLILSVSLSRCQDAGSDASDAVTPRFAGAYVHPPQGRFPYMCSIRPTSNRSKHVCGGILVHPRWILTAAHCVDPRDSRAAGALPFIYCGIYDVEEEREEHIFFATDTVFPDEWNGDAGNGYDIALLLLNRAASPPFPRLTTDINRPPVGRFLAGLGWGETGTGSRITKLQYAFELRVISHRICNSDWDGRLNEDIMVCAGIGGDDACKGDSGGPLLQADSPDNNYESGRPELDLIYGIISFGENSCGGSERPGVYTYVGYFQQWVITILQGPLPTPPSPTTSPPSPTPSPPEGSMTIEEVIVAIENDDAEKLRTALEQGLDPATRYNDSSVFEGDSDDTLLHWAARYDSSESAKVLIEFGVDLEARNNFGNTALHLCGLRQAESVAEVLLENGADVNASGNTGYTPIHYASRDGYIAFVRLFIKNGADVNIPDEDGETPLHNAAWKGHADVAKELIDEGADVNAETDAGETPLHYAAKFGHLAVVEALLDAGASKRTRDNRGNRPSSVVCARADPDCTSSIESAIEDLVSL